jgi:hypothetical protein
VLLGDASAEFLGQARTVIAILGIAFFLCAAALYWFSQVIEEGCDECYHCQKRRDVRRREAEARRERDKGGKDG